MRVIQSNYLSLLSIIYCLHLVVGAPAILPLFETLLGTPTTDVAAPIPTTSATIATINPTTAIIATAPPTTAPVAPIIPITTSIAAAPPVTTTTSVAPGAPAAAVAPTSTAGDFESEVTSFLQKWVSYFKGKFDDPAVSAAAPTVSAVTPSAVAPITTSPTVPTIVAPITSNPLTYLSPSPVSTLLPSLVLPTASIISIPQVSPTSSIFTPSTLVTSTLSPVSTSAAETGTSTDGIYDAIYDSQGINVTFAISILDAHNQYRAIHQVAPLSWEVSAYSYAQNDADNYDCSGVLTHTHGPFGENLAAGFPDGPSAVAAWYAEGSTYDYSTESTYNHFTQVVWKGSTKVGCAFKNCQAENWGLYVVCEYDPPGNVIGEEQANVLPPTS